MSNISLLILVLSFSLFYLYIINSLKEDKLSKDLLFFLLIGIILIFTLAVFYFYFQDINLSLIISFLLCINNYLLIREIKNINKRYIIITIPYFLYFIYVFFIILLKFL
ncbi:MAG: hypothetical protein IJ572_02350 [Bacilli bacterium]|nr:hypothetical protein [Bacilli bacterium]